MFSQGLSNSASFERCRFIDSCGTSPKCTPIMLLMNPGVNSSIGNVSFVSRALVIVPSTRSIHNIDLTSLVAVASAAVRVVGSKH